MCDNLDKIGLYKYSDKLFKFALFSNPDFLTNTLSSDIDASYVDSLKNLPTQELKNQLSHFNTYPSSQAKILCIQEEIRRRYDSEVDNWISSLSDPQLISASQQYANKTGVIHDALVREMEKREISVNMQNSNFNGNLDYISKKRQEVNDHEYNRSHLSDDH